MTGFASKLINALFIKAPARAPAVRRRAALGLEPLELRAVLSTVVPTTVADDVVVDGPIITGQDYDSARSGGGTGAGGMSGGKVSMQDFHFNRPVNAASRHAGGVNVLLSDGSVRFIKDSIELPPTHVAHDATAKAATRTNESVDGNGGTIVYSGLEQARSHGGGGGAGKVSMQDYGSVWSSQDKIDPADIIVGAGPGAPGGHVKVFDGSRGAELGSFFAFPGFNGGVSVGAASASGGFNGGIVVGANDVGDAAGSTNSVVGVRNSGIDYGHPDLYLNVWINQALESIIDDIAADVANQR